MFQFTDNYGTPVYDAMVVASNATLDLNPRDITHLPLWVAAAKAADDAGYCPVYDEIASTVGGPTRADLRELGVLTRRFNVEVTRNVRVYVDLAQSATVEVEAISLAEARSQVEDGYAEIEWPDVSGFDLRYENVEFDDDGDFDIERAYAA
jgi:hypothetical protein